MWFLGWQFVVVLNLLAVYSNKQKITYLVGITSHFLKQPQKLKKQNLKLQKGANFLVFYMLCNDFLNFWPTSLEILSIKIL